ncbi:hypothetical protein SAY87_017268 [Trapa incisa]|uniref:Leucine-rich repeat-containing N-terminal plant-type domain-containing protein n=1 Tax=Trapa incisa TaxID=236973 RepID=A0AAN7LJE1_9MYRT|nr:hypothetical protein SAY87_017268 [Trapa incisa]
MAVAHLLMQPVFVCVLLILTPARTRTISQFDALLKLKRSFTNPAALDSWNTTSDPCMNVDTWVGVSCYGGIVTGLQLRAMNLSGEVDVDALLEIPGLRTISFVNNSFSGSIPEFNRAGSLKAVYLSGNQFSGAIPMDYFVKMGSLKKLWLSENQFSGKIPSSISQLSHLIDLHLEDNQFSGEIPSIEIPALVSFNLSNNELEGEIPPSLSKFDASSFTGNAGLCGKNLGLECRKEALEPTPPPNDNQDSGRNENSVKKSTSNVMAPVAVVLMVLLIIAVILIFMTRTRRIWMEQAADFDVLDKGNIDIDEQPVQKVESKSNRKEMELPTKDGTNNLSSKGSNSSQPRGSVSIDLVVLNSDKGKFGMVDLMKAAAEVLGNSGLGSSYKAVIPGGLTVVVKRVKEVNGKGKEEFDAEMRKLGEVRTRTS